MLEEWRNVDTEQGVLFVSNFGNVINDEYFYVDKNGKIFTKRSLLRKQYIGNHGYQCFRFRGKLFLTHRLVAQAFVSGDKELHINHKDGNKLNNLPSNLEWVTVAENNKHARESGLIPEDIEYLKGCEVHNSKLTENDVIEILNNMDKPLSHFSKKFNVSTTTINDVMIGKKWKHVSPEIPRKEAVGGKRKLSQDDITTIRNSDLSNDKLAKVFGLSKSSIRDIKLYLTYKEM